jgi:hypothetical protein
MSGIPRIFVSSAHYGLEDLRASLKQALEDFGTDPKVSSELGFQVTEPNLPPYAQCIRVLEECALVVGVIDARYGTKFQKWGKYKEYENLSPTHGEIRHALNKGIPLNVFVRKPVWVHYSSYREAKKAGGVFAPPKGFEEKTFQLLEEVKLADPAPWIEPFDDVRDIIRALKSRLLGYASVGLSLGYRVTQELDPVLRDAILTLDPQQRKILERVIKDNPSALELLKAAAPQHTPKQPPASSGTLILSTNSQPWPSLEKLLAGVDLASAVIRLSKPNPPGRDPHGDSE